MSGEGDTSGGRGYRLFSQSWFWLLVLHAVLSQMATLLLRVTTSYRAIEIALDPAWLAIFSVAYSLFPLVFGIAAGRATDRYGERPTLLVGGTAVLIAAISFIFFGDSILGLLLCNMVLGFGHVLGMLGEQSLASKWGPSIERDRIFGYYTVFVSLGQVLSPLFIGAVGGSAIIPDTHALFVGTAVIATLSLLVSFPIQSSPQPTLDGPAEKPGSILSLFRIPGMSAAMFASVIVLAAMDLLLVYLPALGTERHIEAATISLLLSLRAAASMLSRLSFHTLISWLGRRHLMVWSIAIAAASMAILPLDMPLWAMGVTITIAGFVLGLCLPLTLAWMAEITPFPVRSTVVSLRLSGNRLGQILIPSLAGTVAVWAGLGGIFWSTGAALALVAFTTARAFAKQAAKKNTGA
jgi:MFS family permease